MTSDYLITSFIIDFAMKQHVKRWILSRDDFSKYHEITHDEMIR